MAKVQHNAKQAKPYFVAILAIKQRIPQNCFCGILCLFSFFTYFVAVSAAGCGVAASLAAGRGVEAGAGAEGFA